MGLQPEDVLILLVAGVVALNRGFSSTGLKSSQAAYVVIQIINLAACVLLFFFRLEDWPENFDFWIRTFLTLFVGWQMVNNNQVRVELRRDAMDQERRRRDRERKLEAIHAENADLHPPAGVDEIE